MSINSGRGRGRGNGPQQQQHPQQDNTNNNQDSTTLASSFGMPPTSSSSDRGRGRGGGFGSNPSLPTKTAGRGGGRGRGSPTMSEYIPPHGTKIIIRSIVFIDDNSFSVGTSAASCANTINILANSRSFFNSSLVPQFCSNYPNKLLNHRQDTDKYMLLFLKFSSTLQFTSKLSISISIDEKMLVDILRHLVENTRYFSRTLHYFQSFKLNGESLSLLNQVKSLRHLQIGGASEVKPKDICKFLHDHPFTLELEELILQHTVSDAIPKQLEPLSRFRNLKSLVMSGSKVSLDDFSFLENLINLTNLNLDWCEQFGDENGLVYLSSMVAMEHLSLKSTKITDEGMQRNLSDMRFLKSLAVTSCDGLKGQFLKELFLPAGKFVHLKKLNVLYCHFFDPEINIQIKQKYEDLHGIQDEENEDGFEMIEKPSAFGASWARIYLDR